MSHRKIPAIRGLFWCIQAWRNLRASPQPVLSMALWLSLGVLLPGLNFFVLVLLSVFYGGVISTLHKKARGEAVWLGDFFNGFKSLSRFLGLFMTGFPSLLFAMFSSAALLGTLGPDAMEVLAQTGKPPSREFIESVAPALIEVMLKLLPIGIVIGWMVFLAVPRVALDKRLFLPALWDAIRAIFSNLGALLVFSTSMLVAVVACSFLLAIPLALIGNAGALAGAMQTFVLVFLSTVGWAVYLNAMYLAWRDIFMQESSPSISENTGSPDTQIEV